MIDNTLQQAISTALNKLYGIEAAPESVVLQKTKKEFSGDYTVVVFPYVKQARKSPEAVANELGAAVKEALQDVIADFNVIKGFLNFTVCDDYWLAFANSIANTSKTAKSFFIFHLS